MLKKLCFVLFFFPAFVTLTQIWQPNPCLNFGVSAYGQNILSNASPIINNFKPLSSQQLLDTANYYISKHSTDTALLCYSLLINSTPKTADFEEQKKVVEALNRSGIIYCKMYDYRSAYDYFIRALLLCEKLDYEAFQARILLNIGNIYYHFGKYDIAKSYYSRALYSCSDSIGIVLVLSNLGALEWINERNDSAFYYLSKSLEISKRQNNTNLYNILNNFASLYENIKSYDSAFYYYQLALNEAIKNDNIECEAENLSDMGKLFFEIKKTDSALYYIGLSNALAEEHNFLRVLIENYLTLSKIEESKKNTVSAFKYYKKYAQLKDSIFNVKNFGEINEVQHLYEVTKTNQQIEQLAIEQQINERTIHYQRIIQFITFGVLLLVSIILLYVFFQKRELNKAYKALFEKNIEIIELQDNSSERGVKKYKKSTLTDNMQDELLDRILFLMEDSSIICDSKFTVDKLAELAQSNQFYVSQVINSALKKNFRSLLNSYRIREAQRLFSAPDAAKYTIESVSLRVGFKSQSAFRDAFKEITGVNPNFYFRSVQGQR